ncbi:MAG TPA: hypothetical protein VFQ22_08965, partial [Longimicrobiales bacterium]|nr:hypothetical protein [Longimicrobiales bacterium]
YVAASALNLRSVSGAVTRDTAPDTERRLSALAATYGPTGSDGAGLFLVSFYSERPDVRFVPEDVQLVSQGFRLRPLDIFPLTPTWGEHRVDQREQQTAVYRFAESVDLESDLVLAYGSEETARWSAVLAAIRAERARVRARAGLGG